MKKQPNKCKDSYFLQTWMKSNMVRGRRSSKIAISLENLLRIPPVTQRKFLKNQVALKRFVNTFHDKVVSQHKN